MESNKSMAGANVESLQVIVTEAELLKLTGLKKANLAHFRNSERLPYIRLTKTCRLYIESDIVEWLRRHRVLTGTP